METCISVNGLEKSYTRNPKDRVLHGLSFEVRRGGVTGFLGPNGAGKTTTLHCILDILYPDAGDIRIFGASIQNPDVRSRVGVMLDKPGFYGFLTGRESLELHGRLAGMKGIALSQRISELTETFQLDDFINKRTAAYSYGTLQKLSFAQAVLAEPELLILDEPLSGLDPLVMAEVRRYILDFAHKEGKTVFLSSHLLSEMERLCDHVILIHHGKTVRTGSVSDMLEGRKKFRITIDNPQSINEEVFTFRLEGGNVYDLIPKKAGISEADVQKLCPGTLSVKALPLSLEDVFFESVQS